MTASKYTPPFVYCEGGSNIRDANGITLDWEDIVGVLNAPPSGVVGLVPEGIELAEVRAIPSPSQWHPWFQARLIDRQRLVNNDNPCYWLGEGRDVESAVMDAATKTGGG